MKNPTLQQLITQSIKIIDILIKHHTSTKLQIQKLLNIPLLPQPSPEQLKIIESILTHNIIVDSVAGSGKTTTILLMALYYPQFQFTLITYNKKLKIETKEKILLYNIPNLTAYSYHSFCVKHYDPQCHTDKGIINMLKENPPPKINFNFNILIIDEAQDMQPTYYELICKIITNNSHPIKICIIGDYKQCIYHFNSADPRYITQSQKIFQTPLTNFPFKSLTLSQTFRLTKPMTEFINNCLIHENKLISNKLSSFKPRYIITNVFDSNQIFQIFQSYKNNGYTNEDFFIIAPSVKNKKSPLIQFSEILSKNEIPIHVPLSDEEKLEEKILKGKVSFSTYHQTKGLERKITFVFNFDATYYQFYNKLASPDVLSNELYVATTRSQEHLILFHHYTNNFFNFIIPELLPLYTNFQNCGLHLQSLEPSTTINIPVTELIRYLPISSITNILTYIQTKQIKTDPTKKINIKTTIESNNLHEEISDITGTAIPSYYELQTHQTLSIINTKHPEKYQSLLHIFPNNKVSKTIIPSKITIPILLQLSNIHNSLQSGYNHKLKQITTYDWLTEKQLTKCMERLSSHLPSKNTNHEFLVEQIIMTKHIYGNIDCIDHDNKIMWEFKCTTELKDTHIIQLAIYSYMHQVQYNKSYTCYLYNILTNEKIQITINNNFEEGLKTLIYNKYFGNETMTDEKFLKINKKIRQKYF